MEEAGQITLAWGVPSLDQALESVMARLLLFEHSTDASFLNGEAVSNSKGGASRGTHGFTITKVLYNNILHHEDAAVPLSTR